MKQNKLLNKLVEHKKLPQHITPLFEIKKTERLWHFPVLAGVCIGLCLFIGWYFNKMQYGTLSSVGALSILYFTHASLSKRMIHIVVCSFGISFSFAFGSVMAFSQISSVLALVFIAFLSHLVTGYFEVSPPGNFFFIMVCSLAINIPFNINTIPTDVGLVVMGAMLSVLLAFLYSVFVAKKEFETLPKIIRRKKRYTKVVESLIIAVACGLDLTIGYLMKIKNPYWICVATIAVLQGKNLRHTSHRNFQRIIGTFVGLGLTWLLLMFVKPASLGIVVAITFLQIVTEFLVVRNYMLAAIFITPLAILLAESAGGTNAHADLLMTYRFLDTVIGSLIGLLAGWLLYHDTLIKNIEKKLRSIKIHLSRNHSKTNFRFLIRFSIP